MKIYPLNRSSAEGQRIFRLMDGQFNKGQLDTNTLGGEPDAFQGYIVNGDMQCRIRTAHFVFSSNLSGFKRPQVQVKADVELAYGDFADQVSSLDFTNNKQELPISYIVPLNDESLKLLIDAGMYVDNDFEKVFGKVLKDELFNAEGDMTIYHLDIPIKENEEYPLLLVDPVHIVEDDFLDSGEQNTQSSINSIVQWGAHRMIDLRRRGTSLDNEVVAGYHEIKDITPRETVSPEVNDENTVYSSVLNRPLDITSTLGEIIRSSSTEDRIQDIKREQRALEYSANTLSTELDTEKEEDLLQKEVLRNQDLEDDLDR